MQGHTGKHLVGLEAKREESMAGAFTVASTGRHQ